MASSSRRLASTTCSISCLRNPAHSTETLNPTRARSCNVGGGASGGLAGLGPPRNACAAWRRRASRTNSGTEGAKVRLWPGNVAPDEALRRLEDRPVLNASHRLRSVRFQQHRELDGAGPAGTSSASPSQPSSTACLINPLAEDALEGLAQALRAAAPEALVVRLDGQPVARVQISTASESDRPQRSASSRKSFAEWPVSWLVSSS